MVLDFLDFPSTYDVRRRPRHTHIHCFYLLRKTQTETHTHQKNLQKTKKAKKNEKIKKSIKKIKDPVQAQKSRKSRKSRTMKEKDMVLDFLDFPSTYDVRRRPRHTHIHCFYLLRKTQTETHTHQKNLQKTKKAKKNEKIKKIKDPVQAQKSRKSRKSRTMKEKDMVLDFLDFLDFRVWTWSLIFLIFLPPPNDSETSCLKKGHWHTLPHTVCCPRCICFPFIVWQLLLQAIATVRINMHPTVCEILFWLSAFFFSLPLRKSNHYSSLSTNKLD